MPEFHCIDCHHEWEGGRDDVRCSWCGEPGVIIAQKSALERYIEVENNAFVRGMFGAAGKD